MTNFLKIATSRHIVINAFKIAVMVGKPAEFGESGRKHAAWRYNLIALSGINYLVPYAWQVTVQRGMRLN